MARGVVVVQERAAAYWHHVVDARAAEFTQSENEETVAPIRQGVDFLAAYYKVGP